MIFRYLGSLFDVCLENLNLILECCKDTNLVLNWEKCHFMVKESVVLRHKILKHGMEMDRAKVEIIEKLPPPTTIKGVRSFLGRASYYRRFIKDFSKIAKPLCNLLEKDVPFNFDNEYLYAFNEYKARLIITPIIIASDYATGAALDQGKIMSFTPCIMQVKP